MQALFRDRQSVGRRADKFSFRSYKLSAKKDKLFKSSLFQWIPSARFDDD